MKLTLFICVSFIASLLHAAVMPIGNIGDEAMAVKVEMAGQQIQSIHHAKMMESDHHHSEDYCPDNNYSCCLMLGIQSSHINPVSVSRDEVVYASSSYPPPSFRPEILFRPPKLHAVLAA